MTEAKPNSTPEAGPDIPAAVPAGATPEPGSGPGADGDDGRRSRSFEITEAEIVAAMHERANAVRGEVNLPGFRAGQAPVELIVRRFADRWRPEIMQELCQARARALIPDPEVAELLRAPEIRPDEGDGEAGVYRLRVEYQLLPDIPEIDLAAMEFEEVEWDFGDTAMRAAIEKVLAETPAPGDLVTDRPAQPGDVVEVESRVFVQGRPYRPRGQETNRELVQASEAADAIPLARRLCGASVGDTIPLDYRFPPNFEDPRLRGARGELHFSVVEIRELGRLRLDEESIASQGYESEADLVRAYGRRIRLICLARGRNYLHEQLYRAVAGIDVEVDPRLERNIIETLERDELGPPDTATEAAAGTPGEDAPAGTPGEDPPREEASTEGASTEGASTEGASAEDASAEEVRAAIRLRARRMCRYLLLTAVLCRRLEITVETEDLARVLNGWEQPTDSRVDPEQYFQQHPQQRESANRQVQLEKLLDTVLARARRTRRQLSPSQEDEPDLSIEPDCRLLSGGM